MDVKSLLKFNKTRKNTWDKFILNLSQVILFVFIYSCSQIKIPSLFYSEEKIFIDESYQSAKERDYEDHLYSLKTSFLENPEIKLVNLPKNDQSYLTSIANELLENNEVFFKNLSSAQIYILDINTPLHFSLPKGIIFLSSGLVSKYVKHESVLAAVLTYELIKSEKNLYPKKTLVPIGLIDLERIVQLNRLTIDESIEVHKWAYHISRRAGFEGEYYLYWLQTQNRNTADFLMQVGDVNQINREESLFKAFLIREAKKESLPVKSFKNSSKKFYKFINRLRENINEIRAI